MTIREERERKLWHRVHRYLSPKVFAIRIENGVSAGDPDVFMMKGGRVVWIELKFCNVPARKSSMLLGKGNLRLDQINWHLNYSNKGGTSYVLIGTNDLDYLLPGALAAGLNEMSLEEIEVSAVAMDKSIGRVLEKVLWP
jgi:hypothetical protein